MNAELKKILGYLLRNRIIGARHLPEDLAIRRRIRWMSKDEQKELYEDYEQLISCGMIIRLKKRTGKGSDYHISLNPEMLVEINDLIGEEND